MMNMMLSSREEETLLQESDFRVFLLNWTLGKTFLKKRYKIFSFLHG
jgi:hypothetical protein